MRSVTSFGFLLAVLACSAASGQEWAGKMFPTQRHDFGTIARSSKAVFEFPLDNLYVQDVHIASARSSCGCTIVSIKDDKRTLKTHEQGAIVARINSAAFQGQRGATITVTFDKPYPAEVRLQVGVFIRSDVVFEPGSVQFGPVEQGAAAARQVAISCPTGGLQITGVKSANPHLTGKLSAGAAGASYQLQVALDGAAPVGYLHDHLMLTTSDRQEIPVLVEGLVQSAISVNPGWLLLGSVPPGQKVTRQVVVQAKEPLRITRVTPDGDGFQFDLSAAAEPKRLHVIPVTFVAGEAPGKVSRAILIETDRPGVTGKLTAQAVVATSEAMLVQHVEPVSQSDAGPAATKR